MPNPALQSPFASDASSLRTMLQNAFAALPQAAVIDNSMPMPGVGARPEVQYIDLGAGGPRPGSERASTLGSIGDIAQSVAPLVGGALANRASGPTTQGAGAWNRPGPQITAPQLGQPAPFSTAGLNYSLSAPTPQFTLGANPTIRPAFSLGR